MERALDKLWARARDAAHRVGLPRFWRWWTAELAPLVPAAPRSEIQRRRTRPIIEFGEGEAILWRPELAGSAIRLAEVARIRLSGDAAAVASDGRAAVAALLRDAQRPASGPPRVVVALAPRQVLRKDIVLPAAVEENLHRTLAYDLDRHTPFRAEQLYFDAAVVARDLANRSIRVQWAAALRTVVDAARKQAEDWGASVAAIVPGPAAIGRVRLNLLPEEERPPLMLWRRWQVWAPGALVAAVALATVLVPLVQKREYTIALLQQTAEARAQAEVADALRRDFERQQGDYNYVLTKKYAWPGTVQVLDEVTRILPDDTWITQFEMKTTLKGKEVQREVFLRGESANGGKLISLLEDSKLVEQVALRSPTTKLQPGPGEVFDLGGVLRALGPPAPQVAAEAAVSQPPAATAASSAGAPPAGAPQASGPAAAAPPATSASLGQGTVSAPAPTGAPTPAQAPAPAADSSVAVPPATAAAPPVSRPGGAETPGIPPAASTSPAPPAGFGANAPALQAGSGK
ncbi:MAG TPA: PilN domain-containing protein [Casimicrobiaceae bacterium]|nr:PilN domain-containing protein [Casimicrobiaceae bacterium]